jgi:hypothetical protein
MDGFDHNTHTHIENLDAAGTADLLSSPAASTSATTSTGSSVRSSDLDAALNQLLPADEKAATPPVAPDDHDHAPPINGFEVHVDLTKVSGARGLDVKKLTRLTTFKDSFGTKGDYINPGAGNNTVIGSGDSDVIRAKGRGLNTITTGTGKDSIILGRETTNRIFDFDPANDRFVLSGINPKDIIIAQGTNPGKGGLAQPTDSVSNALVIDKSTSHILATLSFVKSGELTEANFVRSSADAERSLRDLRNQGFATKRGQGQVTGTQRHERLIGSAGDDFIYVGDDGFKFNPARAESGASEFPFPNDSPGSTEVSVDLKGGVLRINGNYQNFDGSPLFSQGETAIDPNATILNGSDPVALINGFLRVPQDKEGNAISGTHLHLSPGGDNRGNFADATVIRYFTNTPTDAKSGTISGEFELAPDEQAALLAGNFYINLHTNVDSDGDGKAGFPTGENRVNLNRGVVQFV